MNLLGSSSRAGVGESSMMIGPEKKIPAPKLEEYEISVKGYDSSLPRDLIKRSLIEHFSQCGEVTNTVVPGGPYTKDLNLNPPDIAIVDVEGYDIEKKALNLNGRCKCDVKGCKIAVHKFIPPGNPDSPPARFYSPLTEPPAP